MAAGKFITFEGGEGAGKSTQAELLRKNLTAMGVQALLTREPGGSPRAEAIRSVLLSGRAKRFGPMGEALLFYVARDSHLELTIRPALARGTWVCDASTIPPRLSARRAVSIAVMTPESFVVGATGGHDSISFRRRRTEAVAARPCGRQEKTALNDVVFSIKTCARFLEIAEANLARVSMRAGADKVSETLVVASKRSSHLNHEARQSTMSGVRSAARADRLEGWPHPRETAGLGPEPRASSRAIASAGCIMPGQTRQGIGKAAFAYRTAIPACEEDPTASGLAPSTSRRSRAARQVANLSHPGLLTIKRGWDASGKKSRQSIAIDDIRQLRHFLQRTAVTPWRVVIVDSADDLNPNSANALLKSLEEPPARTVFFLISSSAGRLLPTIRSRCRTIRFEPLPDIALREAVPVRMPHRRP